MEQPLIKKSYVRGTGLAEMQCIQLLQSVGVHITVPRIKVLLAFLQNQKPLTQADVKQACACTIDRVTIYRTLGLLVEHEVLHILPATDGTLRYAMFVTDTRDHRHVHFICKTCHQTFCLSDVYPPHILPPEGFVVKETEVILKGYCKDCTDAFERRMVQPD